MAKLITTRRQNQESDQLYAAARHGEPIPPIPLQPQPHNAGYLTQSIAEPDASRRIWAEMKAENNINDEEEVCKEFSSHPPPFCSPLFLLLCW